MTRRALSSGMLSTSARCARARCAACARASSVAGDVRHLDARCRSRAGCADVPSGVRDRFVRACRSTGKPLAGRLQVRLVARRVAREQRQPRAEQAQLQVLAQEKRLRGREQRHFGRSICCTRTSCFKSDHASRQKRVHSARRRPRPRRRRSRLRAHFHRERQRVDRRQSRCRAGVLMPSVSTCGSAFSRSMSRSIALRSASELRAIHALQARIRRSAARSARPSRCRRAAAAGWRSVSVCSISANAHSSRLRDSSW